MTDPDWLEIASRLSYLLQFSIVDAIWTVEPGAAIPFELTWQLLIDMPNGEFIGETEGWIPNKW